MNQLAEYVPPSHTELFTLVGEVQVLRALIRHNEKFEDIASIIGSKDFYESQHGTVFEAISEIRKTGLAFDKATLEVRLKNKIHPTVLNNVFDYSKFDGNAETHANLVKEFSIKRLFVSACEGIIKEANDHSTSLNLFMHHSQAIFNKCCVKGVGQAAKPSRYSDILPSTMQQLRELRLSGSSITGLTTGFEELDKLTTGLQDSDLIILAARPSMGKTTLGMCMAQSAAVKTKRPVLVFSLEMPKEQLMLRSISSMGKIDANRLRTGQLSSLESQKLVKVTKELNEIDLHVDDASGITVDDINSRALKFQREHGDLAMVVIDYLQLIRVAKSSGNKAEDVGVISGKLKQLAKQLKAPVVALSQLNRSLEKRPDKRPMNSDLRDSGAIEQDADVIMFVYRDEVYNPDSQDKQVAEIILGKQRNGPLGTAKLRFKGEYTLFENFKSLPDMV